MLPPATWYPDPSGRHEHRYWDGERWTEHVADAGIAAVDPLPTVTADEQVDGGIAADIAAVALAATSTADTDRDPDAGEQEGTPPPLWRRVEHRRRRTDDQPSPRRRRTDPSGDEESDREDAWATAAAAGFVMPSETIESLAAEQSQVARPAFAGSTIDGTDVAAANGIGHAGGGLQVPLHVRGPGVVVATRWIRRVVGTCDLEPTTPGWARHVLGEGSLTLVADGTTAVVSPLGADVVVRSDRFVAASATGPAHAVATVVDAVDLGEVDWLAVATSDGLTAVVVDEQWSLPLARLVAWTGGVVLGEGRRGRVELSGHGTVLLDVDGD